jgi:hypothetical protein
MTQKTKKFFLFSPPWKSVNILFSNQEVQDTKLFQSLAFKLAPPWYVKLRKLGVWNLFLKTTRSIPNETTFLIYNGYDSKVFFNKEASTEITVQRLINGKYVNERFLGYPIHYDFSLNKIPNKELLGRTLATQWLMLKKDRKNAHGDFTHSNILVDNNRNVSLIDKKSLPPETPIINDLFYFYSYFLRRARIFKNDSLYENYLRDIYSKFFRKQDTPIKTIDSIGLETFYFCKREEELNYWKTRFKLFLKSLPDEI